MVSRVSIFSLLAGLAIVQPAAAQVVRRVEPEPAKPADPVPQSSTSTFNNWNLICQQGAEAGQRKRCEVAQTLVDAKKQPLLHIALGFDAAGRRSLVVVTPVSIRVEVPIAITIEGSPLSIKAPFRYCQPAGCFAETDVSESDLAALRAKPDAKATLQVGTIERTTVRVPLSLLGFDPAWTAYVRELRPK